MKNGRRRLTLPRPCLVSVTGLLDEYERMGRDERKREFPEDGRRVPRTLVAMADGTNAPRNERPSERRRHEPTVAREERKRAQP